MTRVNQPRNDMRDRMKEATQSTAKKVSESHFPRGVSNDTMHSHSQLGTIREEMDEELALGAEIDLQ